jgi:hypothetical protein
VNLNYYFIKYYFPIFFKRIISNPISFYFMQAKPLCYAHKVYSKTSIGSENLFVTALVVPLTFRKFYKVV